MKCGIYKIVNRVNGKYYVGSSNKIPIRWTNHKIDLRKNTHKNEHLQHAWNKYGESNFDFVTIKIFHEDIDRDYLLEKEQKYLNLAKSEKHKCYNLCFDASGGKLTELSRRKISIKNKGINNGFYGKQHSDISRIKMRQFRKLRIGNLAPCYGKKHSPKTIELFKKMRAGNKNSAYDSSTYNLVNIDTNEAISETMFNLRHKFQFSRPVLSRLINGHIKSYRRWRCSNIKHRFD